MVKEKCSGTWPDEKCKFGVYKDGLCRVHYEEAQSVAKTKGNKTFIEPTVIGQLINFPWPVREYEVLPASELNTEPLLSPIKGKPWKYIEPLKDENLHLRLAEVDPRDNNSILAFVNKYGPLGFGYKYKTGMYAPFVESLRCFQREARKIKDLVDILKVIKDGKEATSRAFKLIDSGHSVCSFGIEAGDKRLIECRKIGVMIGDSPYITNFPVIRIDKLTPDKKVFLVKLYFLNKVIEGMSSCGVYPSAGLTPKGEVVPGYKTPTLIGAVYLQLYFMFTKRLNYRVCEAHGCNNLFVLTRRDRHYCSNNCSARVRNRNLYQANKELADFVRKRINKPSYKEGWSKLATEWAKLNNREPEKGASFQKRYTRACNKLGLRPVRFGHKRG